MSTNLRRTLIAKNEIINERNISSPVRARSPVNKTPMDNSDRFIVQQKSISELEAERYSMRQKEQAAMHEKKSYERPASPSYVRFDPPSYNEFLADYMYGLYAFEIFRREYTKTGKDKEMHEVPISEYAVNTLRINKRCIMCDFDIPASEADAKVVEMKKQNQLTSKDGFSFATAKADSREIKLTDKIFMRIRRLQRFDSPSLRAPVIEFYTDFLTNVQSHSETTR